MDDRSTPRSCARLLAEGLVPVVATIAPDASGQAYNINADAVAGAIAESLGAREAHFLTDVSGVRSDAGDPASVLSQTTAGELDDARRSGAVVGGMIPKARACAKRCGTASRPRHILDGRVAHALLLELFTGRAWARWWWLRDPPHADLPRAAVRFVSGHGAGSSTTQGRSTSTSSPGSGSPRSVMPTPSCGGAIAAQAARLLHVSNIFGNEFNEDVAAQLDCLIGDGTPLGGQVFFANSGAEANECAIKLARRHGGPGRYGVVSALGSFHGRTLATLHATGQPAKHEAFLPLPAGFSHVAYGDLEALRAIDPTAVVAVLLELILGESGVVPPPPGYLASVRAICDELGLLLIVDEIQTGLGRTGRWFAFQHEGIVPDIVTVAKALGNGVPVGACWARPEVAKAFRPGDHGSTFGGQPFAMAVAQATLGRMRGIDAPGIATRGSGAASRGRSPSSTGSQGCAARGFLLGAVLEDGLDSRAVFGEALAAGLVVNAPVPGVIRLDAAVRRHRVRLRRGGGSAWRRDRSGGSIGSETNRRKGMRLTRNLLLVSDLAPGEITDVLDLAERAASGHPLRGAARPWSSSSPRRGRATPLRWPSSSSAGIR